MRELRLFLLLFGIAVGLSAGAQPPNQDCSGAINLCAQQPLTGQNNTNATGTVPSPCPPGDNLLWYTFTTNSQGGAVNVAITEINCPDILNMYNQLSATVFSGDGSCTPASFVSVSPCGHDSLPFHVNTQWLQPATQYWIVVSGALTALEPIAAQCGFTIDISGPGANIVGVDLSAGPDVVIAEGSNTQLHATGGTTWLWTPSSGLSGDQIQEPFAQPNETTTYTVQSTINDCVYTDDVVVEVKRLIDPGNTITPNGDGHNDTWEINGIQDYPQADVSIYDRWGQRVFHSVGYKTPFTGEGLPMATYYWVIELNKLEGQTAPYTGSITIVH